MARTNTYHVTAYDKMGNAILTEKSHYATHADKLARELAHYPNVGTVDVTVNDKALRGRILKTTDSTGLWVDNNGVMKNIRF